jgi:hypothetical protein
MLSMGRMTAARMRPVKRVQRPCITTGTGSSIGRRWAWQVYARMGHLSLEGRLQVCRAFGSSDADGCPVVLRQQLHQ